MKALFTICEGWRNCKNEDLQDLYEKKETEGKYFRWPLELELDELNKICIGCKHPLEIKKTECPVCGGTVLRNPEFPIPSEIKAISATQYFYKCMNCNRHLYSFNKIL